MSGIIVLILRFFLILCLYAFAGFALYTLWRELKAAGSAVVSRQIPALQLQITEDLNSLKTFTSPDVTIGRDPNCEFPIPLDIVSAHHARLSYHHNQWWLQDLHSTNGTYLNTERVQTPTVVVSGDEIHIGQVGLQIYIETPQNTGTLSA